MYQSELEIQTMVARVLVPSNPDSLTGVGVTETGVTETVVTETDQQRLFEWPHVEQRHLLQLRPPSQVSVLTVHLAHRPVDCHPLASRDCIPGRSCMERSDQRHNDVGISRVMTLREASFS